MNYFVMPGIPRNKTHDDIVAVANNTAKKCGFNMEAIMSRQRTGEIVAVRFVIMWNIRRLTGASYLKIGEYLGRERTTVIHAIKRVDDAIETVDPVYYHVARWLFAGDTPAPVTVVRKGGHGRKKLFSEKDLDRIWEMRRRGVTQKAIAIQYNCSIRTVQAYLQKTG